MRNQQTYLCEEAHDYTPTHSRIKIYRLPYQLFKFMDKRPERMEGKQKNISNIIIMWSKSTEKYVFILDEEYLFLQQNANDEQEKKSVFTIISFSRINAKNFPG